MSFEPVQALSIQLTKSKMVTYYVAIQNENQGSFFSSLHFLIFKKTSVKVLTILGMI